MLHIQYLNQLVAQCICSFACFGHNSWPSLGSWKIQHIQLNPLIKLACSLKMAKNCGRNMLEQWLRINTNTLQSGKLYEPHFFVWLVCKEVKRIQTIKHLNYLIFIFTFTEGDIWQKGSGMPQAEHNSLRNFENNPPKSILQVQEFYVQNRQMYEVCTCYSKNLRSN